MGCCHGRPGRDAGPRGDVVTARRWQDAALCAEVDPELWFPPRGGKAAAAKRICARCPVAAPCLALALATGPEFGIWAGLNADDLRALGAPPPGAGVGHAAECAGLPARHDGLAARLRQEVAR